MRESVTSSTLVVLSIMRVLSTDTETFLPLFVTYLKKILAALNT